MPDHLAFDVDLGDGVEVWAHHPDTDTWVQLPVVGSEYDISPCRAIVGTWELEVRWPERERRDA